MQDHLYLTAADPYTKQVFDRWRDDSRRCARAALRLAHSFGAIAYQDTFGDHAPQCFLFEDGQVPEGWVNSSEGGLSRPKASNREALELIAQLDWPENPSHLMQRMFGMPSVVSFVEKDGSYGMKCFAVNAYGAYQFAWSSTDDGEDGPVVIIAPNFEKSVAHLRKNGASLDWGMRFDPKELPAALRPLTPAEEDQLMRRSSEMEMEEEAAEAAPAL